MQPNVLCYLSSYFIPPCNLYPVSSSNVLLQNYSAVSLTSSMSTLLQSSYGAFFPSLQGPLISPFYSHFHLHDQLWPEPLILHSCNSVTSIACVTVVSGFFPLTWHNSLKSHLGCHVYLWSFVIYSKTISWALHQSWFVDPVKRPIWMPSWTKLTYACIYKFSASMNFSFLFEKYPKVWSLGHVTQELHFIVLTNTEDISFHIPTRNVWAIDFLSI